MKQFTMKNEMVYDYLKDSILSGKLKQGERLNLRELSDRLDMSVVPIREAINTLSAEGFLKITPYVGVRVANIHKAEVEQLHMMRTELECLAIRVSADFIKDTHVNKLEKMISRAEQAILVTKLEKYKELNRQFHLGIYRCSPYDLLTKTISDLYDQLQLVPTLPWTKERAEKSIGEHRLILDALGKGDGLLASEILRRHNTAAWHAL